ncbi:aldose epimerase family protein [Spirochaeta africana]|uniref:Aldose 1-epimerase n=1 Tax=Spirochaeta africana (strain ATCC 700263 / DSM 8902 / Z-7692) TaxID=889378 RepID=H9UGC6_SPIAZ|nr:aldose epimerase family protein [Spirochaeta africana]AFG36569.1 galactose mutarotase-like enzyme [Spirochaeta africana DSM 8902]
MEITKDRFGSAFDGTPVDIITISNSSGITLQCMSYGATLVSLKMPGRDGKLSDLVLGFDSFDDYLKPHPYLGATIGRVAGRISKAQFSIGPRTFTLERNDGSNHLHGGRNGFDKVIWTPRIFGDGDEVGVTFSRTSPDGEEGYPGKLDVEVTYALNDRNELAIRYRAESSKATPVNLTNHTYWNLGGNGSILNHKLRINSKKYLPVDDNTIPMGDILETDGTPMDFSSAHPIGRDIKLVPGGYDHCYVLPEAETRLRPAAILNHPESGRTMEVYTTKPGLQLYTANKLRDVVGKHGIHYGKHSGVCLETMYFPDSVNQHDFPGIILRPKEEYHHETVHRFSIR